MLSYVSSSPSKSTCWAWQKALTVPQNGKGTLAGSLMGHKCLWKLLPTALGFEWQIWSCDLVTNVPLSVSSLSVLQSTWSQPAAVVLRCTAVLEEYMLAMLSLLCGMGTLLMELCNSKALRGSDYYRRRFRKKQKKLVQQEVPILSYDGDMGSVAIHCISRCIHCQLMAIWSPDAICCVPQFTQKHRFVLLGFFSSPGCTLECTTLLLLNSLLKFTHVIR